MARIERLPPPPKNPVRSPAVSVVDEELLTIPGGASSPPLEARIRIPPDTTHAVVICHPHPLYGGSMHSPIPLAIAKVLADRGTSVASIRFNYRGVGESGGEYDNGRGEKEDVLAAVALLRQRTFGVPLHIVGHSFGSWAGFRAAETDGDVASTLLVAPSTRFFDFGLDAYSAKKAGRLALFIGDQDEFCDVDEARALATKIDAEFRVFPGFDHHFMKSRRALAEAAYEWMIQ